MWTPPDKPIEVITIEIAGHEFCIDIGSVREIRGWTAATPLPQAPDYVVGVINLRGAVMPVIDLRARLGFGRTDVSSRHVIVVIQNGEQVAGALVDAVQETIVLQPSQLQPPPRYEDQDRDVLVDALVPLEGRIIGRLRVASLFADGALDLAA